MSSAKRGERTSPVEVTNISRHGFWILLRDRELFLPFEHFPWFADATVAEILEVTLPGRDHLYWPKLDVDLAVDSIENPDRYPLRSRLPAKSSPKGTRRRTKGGAQERKKTPRSR
jgi:hypothetical protein